MKITKRVKWVDIAKAVAILSVIACHTWPGRTTPNITLISFNVPLFFLMTGFTLKPAKNWKEFRAHLKKNFLRILLPAMILLGIMDILFVANGNISGNIQDTTHSARHRYSELLFRRQALRRQSREDNPVPGSGSHPRHREVLTYRG